MTGRFQLALLTWIPICSGVKSPFSFVQIRRPLIYLSIHPSIKSSNHMNCICHIDLCTSVCFWSAVQSQPHPEVQLPLHQWGACGAQLGWRRGRRACRHPRAAVLGNWSGISMDFRLEWVWISSDLAHPWWLNNYFTETDEFEGQQMMMWPVKAVIYLAFGWLIQPRRPPSWRRWTRPGPMGRWGLAWQP